MNILTIKMYLSILRVIQWRVNEKAGLVWSLISKTALLIKIMFLNSLVINQVTHKRSCNHTTLQLWTKEGNNIEILLRYRMFKCSYFGLFSKCLTFIDSFRLVET